VSTTQIHLSSTTPADAKTPIAPPGAARTSMLFMLGFVALWAVVEVAAIPLFVRIPGYEIVWMRYGVHLTLMLLIWGWSRPSVLWRTRRPLYQLSRSLLMLGMPASWIMAGEHGVGPSVLMTVFWGAPLMVLALAPAVLKEPVKLRYWVAAGVAYAGACLLTIPALPSTLSGVVFPFGMAATFAVYVVMTRSLRGETLQANLFYTALGVFAALSLAMPTIWVQPTLHETLVLVAIGVLGFGALLALDRAASTAPLSASVPLIYLQGPIMVALVAAVGYEYPDRRALMGGVMVTCAAIYLWVQEASHMSKASKVNS
jgi:drug/metabolite transporter (DMT)-like permease